MFVWLILALLCATLLYYYVVWLQHYWKRRGVPQGSTVWLFGDLFWYILKRESTADLVKRVYDKCPHTRYSGLYQFTSPTFILKDTELIKNIAIKDFDHFPDHRTYVPEDTDPLWGKNLFAVQGAKWRQMRPVLSPAFTSSKMKMMFNLITDCAENFIRYFHKMGDDVQELDTREMYSRFATDVIGTCAFGLTVDSVNEKDNDFYRKGCELTDFTNFWKNFALFGYLLIPRLYKFLNLKVISDEERKYYVNIIEKTINMRKENGIVRHDMIHLLMEAQDQAILNQENDDSKIWQFTTEDIVAQAIVFYLAGFDAVTILLSYLSYELALHPEIQNKLNDEVQRTFEECEGKVTYEALFKMNYLDMVVSETLRKWPINVEVDRICTKSYTIPPISPEENTVFIDVGTVIWIPIYAIHHDPKYYPDPEKFDPERFSEENKMKIKPGSYLPFGIGPRICLGSRFALMETKVLIFHILLNFDIVPIEKTTIPVKISTSTFNMKPSKRLVLGLKQRKKKN